ncbi:MAG: hypothetical protein QMB62_07475 [Oscillospiraceae bacterium]
MKMEVFSVDREKLSRFEDKHYQVMYKADYGLNHLFPGKFMTLTEAKQVCEENDFEVVKTGTVRDCFIL